MFNTVKWYSDNKGVCSIIDKGSMVSELQEIAFDIHSFCLKSSIILHIEWIPRDQKVRVDYFSKIIEKDDWRLPPLVMELIHKR